MASIIHSVCEDCKFTFGQQNDPEEFFVLWKLPKYLSELNFSCEVKWKMSYQCRYCKQIAYGTIIESYDLLLPVPQNHMNQFIHLSECLKNFFNEKTKNHQDCPFCHKSSIPISKKKIDTLGKVLVVCLSRNTESRKDETAINPDKNLSLKNNKQSCVIDYKLNSVIVHLGNHRAGHYVCFTFGNHSVLRIDDEKIEFVEYNSVRQIIRTCGYIFIYRKIGDHFLNDNESNETDTETFDENNSLSHGKFMKKRKLPRFSNAKGKVDERSRYVRVEFKPVYIAEGKFGSQWVNENQSS